MVPRTLLHLLGLTKLGRTVVLQQAAAEINGGSEDFRCVAFPEIPAGVGKGQHLPECWLSMGLGACATWKHDACF